MTVKLGKTVKLRMPVKLLIGGKLGQIFQVDPGCR